MKQRSAAQREQVIAMQNLGRQKQRLKPEPFGRALSGGLMGPLIKTVDAGTRSLIDDAMRKRVTARVDG